MGRIIDFGERMTGRDYPPSLDERLMAGDGELGRADYDALLGLSVRERLEWVKDFAESTVVYAGALSLMHAPEFVVGALTIGVDVVMEDVVPSLKQAIALRRGE